MLAQVSYLNYVLSTIGNENELPNQISFQNLLEKIMHAWHFSLNDYYLNQHDLYSKKSWLEILWLRLNSEAYFLLIFNSFFFNSFFLPHVLLIVSLNWKFLGALCIRVTKIRSPWHFCGCTGYFEWEFCIFFWLNQNVTTDCLFYFLDVCIVCWCICPTVFANQDFFPITWPMEF